jgi:uncharacterized protein
MILGTVFLLFACSQSYWFWRGYRWSGRIRSRVVRLAVRLAVAALYVYAFAFVFGWVGNPHTELRLTLPEAMFAAPFLWWLASSIFGFLAAMAVALVRLGSRAAPPIESPGRRVVLARAATALTAAPFVAGAYGLLYGRLNLETPRQRIRLARLPKAFDGFRIAQLSDIHIGPFMTGDQIRRFAAIANSLHPDLIVLTGDFITWDAQTQGSVVDALSGLKAPFGVFGCLGNHDAWARVEDSITRLFGDAGIRILRHARTSITQAGEALNLIGVDFESRRRMGPSGSVVNRYLAGVEALMAPHTANILLSHNPDTFDRAAELGIDLSLAGHTHGGQAALEFISPEIAPSRLVTPYVAGHFEKPGGQLYVNRGIGTIGVPIRLGAPPEITLFELVRA